MIMLLKFYNITQLLTRIIKNGKKELAFEINKKSWLV